MRRSVRRPVAYGARATARNLAAALCLVLAPLAASAQQVTIAALGDSLTQGYGLKPEDGFVRQLEDWLAGRGHDVEVKNAGVSGDTTAGGLSRVDWTLTDEVDGMIVALGGNDLLRGIDPAESRRNLAGILDRATAEDVPVLLVGMSAPGNYGPDYKQRFDAMYPELAKKYGTLHAPSFLAGLERLEDRGRVVREFMQPDGIHPNAAGVELIVEALSPKVEDLVARAAE